MINLPAELGWISKNLPLGPWPLGCALGPWGRFLLTHPRSAGRFIPVLQRGGLAHDNTGREGGRLAAVEAGVLEQATLDEQTLV